MRTSLTLVVLALLGSLALAQEPALKKSPDGKTYEHEASKTVFTIPDGWTLLLPKDNAGKEKPPETVGQVSFLTFRKVVKAQKPTEADQIYETTVSWSPLGAEIGLEQISARELTVLRQLYGKDKVEEDKEGGKPGERPGTLIVLRDGPSRDGKESGVVYLFETNEEFDPDTKKKIKSWKIKIRATYATRLEKQGRQHLQDFAKHLTFK